MFCTRVAWVCLLLYKDEMLFSSVFAITERRDVGLYEVPLSMSLLGFGMETMLANFHMCGIMLVFHLCGIESHINSTYLCELIQRLTQPLAAKSKLYLLAVGLFALTEIDERRISGA